MPARLPLAAAFVWCVATARSTAVAAAAAGPTLPSAELLGVNIHNLSMSAAELDLLAASGFRWVRTDVLWPSIEPTVAGHYDFSSTDPLMALLAARSMSVVAITSCCNPLYDNGAPPTSPAARSAYAAFAAAFAGRYSNQTVWTELINEPNTHAGAFPNATAYAALASVVAPAVRAAGGTLVGPASSNIDLPWLQQAFESGLLAHVDVVTVHPYRSNSPETVAADFTALRQLVDEYSPLSASIAIASGEWGYSSAPPLGADAQGRLLARQMLVTTAVTGATSIYYEWRDEPNEPMGVVTANLTAKAAYTAAAALSRVLSGAAPGCSPLVFVRRQRVFQSGYSAPDDFVYVYDGRNATVVAAWTSASFQHVVRLPGGTGCWHGVDWRGTPVDVVCHDSRGIHLNVTDAPTYYWQHASEPGSGQQ